MFKDTRVDAVDDDSLTLHFASDPNNEDIKIGTDL
jgi:hypothetical protein